MKSIYSISKETSELLTYASVSTAGGSTSNIKKEIQKSNFSIRELLVYVMCVTLILLVAMRLNSLNVSLRGFIDFSADLEKSCVLKLGSVYRPNNNSCAIGYSEDECSLLRGTYYKESCDCVSVSGISYSDYCAPDTCSSSLPSSCAAPQAEIPSDSCDYHIGQPYLKDGKTCQIAYTEQECKQLVGIYDKSTCTCNRLFYSFSSSCANRTCPDIVSSEGNCLIPTGCAEKMDPLICPLVNLEKKDIHFVPDGCALITKDAVDKSKETLATIVCASKCSGDVGLNFPTLQKYGLIDVSGKSKISYIDTGFDMKVQFFGSSNFKSNGIGYKLNNLNIIPQFYGIFIIFHV